jgi:hypothetical protein
VNRHKFRIWGTEQPYAQIEHQHDSLKVNIFCAVSREKWHGPIFSNEATVTGDSFLDMLENWLLPQLNTNYDDYILQLDGAAPIITLMYECFSIVFFLIAGSDVLQTQTTTFSLGHPVGRILHHAISFFGGKLKTAFMCHHCPLPSRSFVIE